MHDADERLFIIDDRDAFTDEGDDRLNKLLAPR
jgi:hypothetical protein